MDTCSREPPANKFTDSKGLAVGLVKCRVDGCPSTIDFGENAAPDAKFLCSKHPRDIQLQALGREYDPELDEEDSQARFQPFQFDKYLGRPHEDERE